MYFTRKLIPIFICLCSLIVFNAAQESDEEEGDGVTDEEEGDGVADEEEGDGVAVPEFPADPEDPEDPDTADMEHGDLILSARQKQELKTPASSPATGAAKREKYKWPKTVKGKQVIIPYTIQGGVYTTEQLGVIQQAMWDIQNATCVRFIKRKKQKDFFQIYSKKDHGCFSSLGRTGGLQFVSLNRNGCIHRKVVVHELIHVIGFNHMHRRFDRDQYVTIYSQNIKPESQRPFKLLKNQAEAYNTKFDLLSVMMYRKNAASKNGKNTIVPKDLTYLDIIGAVETLSEGDALRINRMYKCPAK